MSGGVFDKGISLSEMDDYMDRDRKEMTVLRMDKLWAFRNKNGSLLRSSAIKLFQVRTLAAGLWLLACALFSRKSIKFSANLKRFFYFIFAKNFQVLWVNLHLLQASEINFSKYFNKMFSILPTQIVSSHKQCCYLGTFVPMTMA